MAADGEEKVWQFLWNFPRKPHIESVKVEVFPPITYLLKLTVVSPYTCGNEYSSFLCLIIDGSALRDLTDTSWSDNSKENCNFREGWVGGRFVITSIFDLTLSPQSFFLDIEMVHFFVKLKARFSFFSRPNQKRYLKWIYGYTIRLLPGKLQSIKSDTDGSTRVSSVQRETSMREYFSPRSAQPKNPSANRDKAKFQMNDYFI